MSLSLRQIAKLKTKYPVHVQAFNIVILAGLSKQRMAFYEFLKVGEFDTRTVAVCFKTSIYHASTILKGLYDLGLLRRRCIVDNKGQRFLWTTREEKTQ